MHCGQCLGDLMVNAAPRFCRFAGPCRELFRDLLCFGKIATWRSVKPRLNSPDDFRLYGTATVVEATTAKRRIDHQAGAPDETAMLLKVQSVARASEHLKAARINRKIHCCKVIDERQTERPPRGGPSEIRSGV
jgi:hypothetical protein